MSAREALQVIARARCEGVTLIAKGNGKIGWRAQRKPSGELLAVLKDRKADILALLPPPPSASFAIGPAKAAVARLQALGFRAYLDPRGALMIADAGGRRRDLSRYLPIGAVFDTIVAGLADDPELLEERR